VHPWINLAGTDVLDAPEPKWRMDAAVLALPAVEATLEPGEVRVVSLAAPVAGRLALWSPDAPRLHGLVLTVSEADAPIDRSYTRFGWREYRIEGGDFLLNGGKLQMFGDLLHPFGPFVNSRRHVWAWYRMIKDMHGNAVRPHAQPHPRHYLKLADEMGLLVLDETALFGSSLQLNFEAPAAWDRYAAHFDNLILRDRNHPSVFGWSWGNELFATFIYDDAISAGRTNAWYGNMAALGARGRRLDPTRDWVSCDGDEDVRGSMPVWNKHFGHGLPHPDAIPSGLNKPLMVGESGGTYYARPAQLAVFNGPRAYESYRGRNEALAIDLYRNIVKLARPRLAFFSPAETAWFGLEHLPFGYDDFTRLPNADDGVWFPPFEEGRPGVQIERLPPYVCTLNPGWDPRLPLYRPLPLFEAQQAAQAPNGPLPSPWDRPPEREQPAPPSTPPPIIADVAFAGDKNSALHQRLQAWGVPLRDAIAGPGRLLIVDGATLVEAEAAATHERAEAVLAHGGVVWLMLQDAAAVSPAVQRLLPATVALSNRPATALAPTSPHPWTAGLDLPALYFAEDPGDRLILRHGLHGPFVEQGEVLLKASNTDWSLFHNVPENAKCAAVVLHEHLVKPPGATLVRVPHDDGAWLLSTIRDSPDAAQQTQLWQTLLRNLRIRLEDDTTASDTSAGNGCEHNLLLDGPPESPP
jgi:beta-galactosidase